MKFVVIGGDAAGMSAASRAKRNEPGLEVIVLEQTHDVSYSACGMPYNIADPARDIRDLVVRQAAAFRQKQGIDLRLGHRVERIDLARRVVSGAAEGGAGFEVGFDRLLIATGASPIRPALPGFDLPGVMTLKSLEDGGRIKAWLAERAAERVVVVGTGYIGLEMAEALRARGIAIDLIEALPRPLPWLEEGPFAVVARELEAQGVRVHAAAPVRAIEAGGPGRRALVVHAGDVALEGDMVLAAVGVRPNSGLARDAGIALGPQGAIAVDRALRTSAPDVFAAGDCADAFHVVTGAKVWIPLALRANRAGWAVADSVTSRAPVEVPPVAGTAVFKVFGLEVARTGLTAAEAAGAGFEPAAATISTRSRAHAHPGASELWVTLVGDRATGRLLGAQMIGREGAAHRIDAAAVALHAGLTVEQLGQADLAYAPPFGPVWDPLLVAANQLRKELR
jgi:NADPH-dependent 2,4-dienoyl-CoA reductase/sulfur reductase-like enzyme